MKLSQLAAKPQLIKLEINDADTVKEFGEPIEFWTWDRQPLETFMKLANQGDNQNAGGMIDVVRTLILDENGKEVIKGDVMLPSTVLIRVISKIVETLGK
jgi:hypothetical protein